MSDLRPASFKGVPFYVFSASVEKGRRNVLHEYPFRDIPYSEDLGRGARPYNFTGYLKTQEELDNFSSVALESEGPGTLIHPWEGTVFVQLQGLANIKFPTAAGGLIEIDLSFIEAGENTEPDAAADTEALLDMAADSVLDQVEDLFGQDWMNDIQGWIDEASSALTGLFDTLESYLEPFDRAVALIDRITNTLQSMINNPLGLSGRIQSRIDAIMNLGKFSGMTAVRSLLNGKVLSAFNPSNNNSSSVWTGNKPATSTTTPPPWTIPDSSSESAEMPPLPPSLADVVRRTLIIETARTLPYVEFNSKMEVAEASSQIMKWLDDEIKNAPDDLYQSLQALQIATANALLAQQEKARDIVTITTQATLPALVIAYQENGNIKAVPDLIARNNVHHPGFVPAGSLEVLKDGK